MKLSFVIPVYNEEGSLKILYKEIIENINKHEYEIIFIDDGSTDTGFSIMKELADKDKNVKAIQFRRNFGKAMGLQVGFDAAEGDIVFTMDADLQDDPIEIPNFIAKIEEGYDMVTGWKVKRLDPLGKTLPSKLFNSVTSSVFKLKLHDYNCGYKAYKREVVKDLDIYGEMHRYIPAIAHNLGYKVGEIPVNHRARTYGKSKYGMERFLRGFFDLLTVQLVTQYKNSPLYLFGRAGSIFIIVGFFIDLYLTVLKLSFGEPLSNRPLLLFGVFLIIVGLYLFSMGLIAELVVNQTRKTKGKSKLPIKTKINL